MYDFFWGGRDFNRGTTKGTDLVGSFENLGFSTITRPNITLKHRTFAGSFSMTFQKNDFGLFSSFKDNYGGFKFGPPNSSFGVLQSHEQSYIFKDAVKLEH